MAPTMAPRPTTMAPRPTTMVPTMAPTMAPTTMAPKPTTMAPKPTTMAPKPTTMAPKPTTMAPTNPLYDNGKIYGAGELVTLNGYTYKKIAYGSSGWGPSGEMTSNQSWTFVPESGQREQVNPDNLHGNSIDTATGYCNWTIYNPDDHVTYPGPPLDSNNRCTIGNVSGSCVYKMTNGIGAAGYTPYASPGNWELIPGSCSESQSELENWGNLVGAKIGKIPITSVSKLSNETVAYFINDGIYTKIVDSNGHGTYYVGSIDDFNPDSYLQFIYNPNSYDSSNSKPSYKNNDGWYLLNLNKKQGNLVAPDLPTVPITTIGYFDGNTLYMGNDGTNTIIYTSPKGNTYSYVGSINQFNPYNLSSFDSSNYTLSL